MIVIAKKIELSINPQDYAFCEGCDFLAHDGHPNCVLYSIDGIGEPDQMILQEEDNA
jgi:hypothetical protein